MASAPKGVWLLQIPELCAWFCITTFRRRLHNYCCWSLWSYFVLNLVQAREAVEMRAQVERKMAQKEKEKHEEKLREMAQKARERRAGIKTHVEKGSKPFYLSPLSSLRF